jgi:hypothetical protein
MWFYQGTLRALILYRGIGPQLQAAAVGARPQATTRLTLSSVDGQVTRIGSVAGLSGFRYAAVQ